MTCIHCENLTREEKRKAAYEMLKSLGISRGGKRKMDYAEIFRLKDQGMSNNAISRMMGVHKSNIGYALKTRLSSSK